MRFFFVIAHTLCYCCLDFRRQGLSKTFLVSGGATNFKKNAFVPRDEIMIIRGCQIAHYTGDLPIRHPLFSITTGLTSPSKTSIKCWFSFLRPFVSKLSIPFVQLLTGGAEVRELFVKRTQVICDTSVSPKLSAVSFPKF